MSSAPSVIISSNIMGGLPTKLGWLGIMGLLLVSIFGLNVSGLTTITEGYLAKEKLAIGSIVSLENSTTDTVVAGSSSNVDNLLGIIVNADSSLLSVSNGNESQVQVTTSGTVPVLVSDINGNIERGDHITASPILGVGMKATANVRIIGIAQSKLEQTHKETLKNKDGTQEEVNVGEIPLLVNVAYFFKEPEKTIIPLAVQNVANALAGRTVSTVPILISAGIFLVTLIVTVSIIYSMIRNSIISVGRNPMSQSAIYRDLVQLSALVLAILGVSVISIYFVLTRL